MVINLAYLEDLFNNIQNIISYFESRRAELFLSNGERLVYKVTHRNIPHLLGINIDYIRATKLFNGDNSFEILQDFISSPYKIYELIQQGHLNPNQIFSEFIDEKVKSFSYNINLHTFETEFVCKYVSDRSFAVSNKNQKFDYIIVKNNKETGAYTILCLVKYEDCYVPMSNMYFENYESLEEALNEMIQNQEVTLLSGVRKTIHTGEYKSFYLPLDMKASKITKLGNLRKKLNCIIDVGDDFKYLSEEYLKLKTKDRDSKELIRDLVESISLGGLIDDEHYLETDLLGIVNAYNDYLCSKNRNVNSDESYSKVMEDRRRLLEELDKLRESVKSLTSDNQKLTEENERLTIVNKGHEETRSNILKLLKSSEEN